MPGNLVHVVEVALRAVLTPTTSLLKASYRIPPRPNGAIDGVRNAQQDDGMYGEDVKPRSQKAAFGEPLRDLELHVSANIKTE